MAIALDIKLWMARNMLIPVWARLALPKIDGDLVIPGLDEIGKVQRDQWGVPHIYAHNTHDLFFLQGFTHTQDRLWQMEVLRRVASGRVAEFSGPIAVNTDRLAHTLGWRRLAEEDLIMLRKNQSMSETCYILDAYVEGINAFLLKLSSNGWYLPVEFKLAGLTTVEPFSVLDCLAIQRLLSMQMSFGWQHMILKELLIQLLGEDLAKFWTTDDDTRNPTTLPCGSEVKNRNSHVINSSVLAGSLFGDDEHADDHMPTTGNGSNSWVISGDRTETGKPILANDPHLVNNIPCIWYEQHLQQISTSLNSNYAIDPWNVTGVTIPGTPGVLVGHNAHAGWGITLSYADVEDVFVERLVGTPDPRLGHSTCYEYDGEILDMSVRDVVIAVKGEKDQTFAIAETIHGPIISRLGFRLQFTTDRVREAYDEADKYNVQHEISYCSKTRRPGLCAMFGLMLLNRAHTYDDFAMACERIDTPSLNISFANVDGDIGYFMTGEIPVRKCANGEEARPLPGWTGEHDWKEDERIPFCENPHSLNPSAGFIVSANHKLVPPDYPHYLGNIFKNGYRAAVITRVLKSQFNHSMDDSMQLQMSDYSVAGIEFVRLLEGFETENKDVLLALVLLRSWNGHLSTDSVGGAIYEVTLFKMVDILLKTALENAIEKNPEFLKVDRIQEPIVELVSQLAGDGFHSKLKHINEFQGVLHHNVLRLLGDPENEWLELCGGKAVLLEYSMREAISWLRESLGDDEGLWKWGTLHTCIMKHSMSEKLKSSLLDVPPFPLAGDTNTVAQAAFAFGTPYHCENAAAVSYRQVLDFSNWESCVSCLPVGQSGQYLSDFYCNQTDLWRHGQYHPMLWSVDMVDKHTAHTLKFFPKEIYSSTKSSNEVFSLFSFVAKTVKNSNISIRKRETLETSTVNVDHILESSSDNDDINDGELNDHL